MAYCKNCGNPIENGANFCNHCGTKVEGDSFQNAADNVKNKFSEFNNTEEYSTDVNDAKENKVYAILAYIGILVLVPIFAAKNSPYARFHANQGLVLIIFEAAYSILVSILGTILAFISPILSFITVILNLGNLFFVALMILGIVNAATDKTKELPLIGKIRILK